VWNFFMIPFINTAPMRIFEIIFVNVILQLSIPKTRLTSIPSSYPGRLASLNPTRDFWLDYCTVLCRRTLLYNHFAWTPRKTPSSILKKACLLTRCLAINVVLLSEFACAGMWLQSRCLATGLSQCCLKRQFCPQDGGTVFFRNFNSHLFVHTVS
jgi:hypothetical protein